ncbi:unnamed protein product [Effrenium voratum]|nr:unnamed protein product [Effrenium voratum]
MPAAIWAEDSMYDALSEVNKHIPKLLERFQVEEALCFAVRDCKFSVSIADPQLPDVPLIAVSEGFENVTGYALADVQGLNCYGAEAADTLASVSYDGPLRRTIVLQECQTLMQLQRDQRATFDNRLQSAFERITVAMQKSHEGMAAVSSTTRQILTEACEPAPQIPFSEEEEPFVPASQPSETALLQTLHMATPRASISSAMFPATLEVRRPSVSSEPDQLQPSGRSSVKDMEASESVEEYGVMRSTYETATGPVASMASPLSSKSPKTPAHMKMLMSKGTKKFEDFAQSFRAYIDYLAGAMVVLNTLCMLVQLEFEGMSRGAELGVVYAPASNYEDVFRVLGAAFVCIFLAEWLFRVAADGRQFPQDLANLFDTALIIVSLADLFLSPLAFSTDCPRWWTLDLPETVLH